MDIMHNRFSSVPTKTLHNSPATAATAALNATVTTDPGSRWFSGHFPSQPILPGVAQLGMVAELLAAQHHLDLRLTALRRVKFKKIVQPGEALDIQIECCDKDDHYFFRITSGNQDVCSGTMRCSRNENTLREGMSNS